MGVNVDDKRQGVYRRKLHVITESIGRIPDDRDSLSPLELDGVLHNVQVTIDAVMDIAAMLVKDGGHEVKDDYQNLEIPVGEGMLDDSLAEELRRLNGSRNAIVHRYNSFEEETLVEGLDRIRSEVLDFAEIVEGRV